MNRSFESQFPTIQSDLPKVTFASNDHIARSQSLIDSTLDGLYKILKNDICKSFETVLLQLNQLHVNAYEKREQELFSHIYELQGQIVELQNQIADLHDEKTELFQRLDQKTEKMIQLRIKKYSMHTSFWSIKKLFLAWKLRTKRQKQAIKTEKLITRYEKKHFSWKYFALLSNQFSTMKYNQQITQTKFKFETLSNEVNLM
jgi:predicted nuclease with TOPRIM domain